MRPLVILFILFYFNLSNGYSQNPILNEFSVIENGKSVYLNWEIAAGFTCNGIKILRSTDGMEFMEIGEIDGVCGSTTEPVGYDFTDKNPVINKKSYYRLEFGGSEQSEILFVEIIELSELGYQVRPNPANTDVKIYFQNDRREKYELILFDNQSKAFYQSTTQQDFFDVDLRAFTSAVYLFKINNLSDGTEIASGKLVVKH